MTIQAQVGTDEIDFNFEFIDYQDFSDVDGELKNGEKWRSADNLINNAEISFISYLDKVVKLEFSPEIVLVENDREATKNLLIDRIQKELVNVIEARESGVEYTGEPSGITPLTTPKPYDPDQIKVRQDKFSVEYVVNKMINRDIIDLNPDFQRKFVWDKKRQSNLIESLMLGIPIPVFYLAEGLDGNFHVIDGLQRLSTLRDFLNDKFYLRNLEHLSDYDSCYYSLPGTTKEKKTLGTKMTVRIETAQLHFNIIEATSPSEVKYDIFTRLNTGGQPLNSQEVRNCIAESHVRNFLNRCANKPSFLNATANSLPSKRMQDQEMVLRFVGFYLQKIKSGLEYTGDMNPFLNETLDILNKMPEREFNPIEEAFSRAMANAYHLFGRFAFRKCLPEDLDPKARKQYINKSMFVVWSVGLSDFDTQEIINGLEFESFAKIVADEMVTVRENIKYNSNYFFLFTSATSDKRILNSASQMTSEIIQDKLIPLLNDR